VEETQIPARQRVKITVELECDREQFPGWGYDPQDMAKAAAERAAAVLASYNPTVTRALWLPGDERWLVDEIARVKNIDKSQARRLIATGQVEVNFKKVEDMSTTVRPGDTVEVFNNTRLISQGWPVK
jgi:hypothetical protein